MNWFLSGSCLSLSGGEFESIVPRSVFISHGDGWLLSYRSNREQMTQTSWGRGGPRTQKGGEGCRSRTGCWTDPHCVAPGPVVSVKGHVESALWTPQSVAVLFPPPRVFLLPLAQNRGAAAFPAVPGHFTLRLVPRCFHVLTQLPPSDCPQPDTWHTGRDRGDVRNCSFVACGVCYLWKSHSSRRSRTLRPSFHSCEVPLNSSVLFLSFPLKIPLLLILSTLLLGHCSFCSRLTSLTPLSSRLYPFPRTLIPSRPTSTPHPVPHLLHPLFLRSSHYRRPPSGNLPRMTFSPLLPLRSFCSALDTFEEQVGVRLRAVTSSGFSLPRQLSSRGLSRIHWQIPGVQIWAWTVGIWYVTTNVPTNIFNHLIWSCHFNCPLCRAVHGTWEKPVLFELKCNANMDTLYAYMYIVTYSIFIWTKIIRSKYEHIILACIQAIACITCSGVQKLSRTYTL